MSKEKQIQKHESKQLIDELSKMPPMVIATAYLHAIDYTLYGEDVTKKWLTATQNASALEKAYQKGYHDAMERVNQESKVRDIAASTQLEQRWIPCSERPPEDDTEVFIYLFDRPSPYIAWFCDGCWFTEDFQVEKEDYPKAWMPLPQPYTEKREE